jgi:hypothetical protein
MSSPVVWQLVAKQATATAAMIRKNFMGDNFRGGG